MSGNESLHAIEGGQCARRGDTCERLISTSVRLRIACGGGYNIGRPRASTLDDFAEDAGCDMGGDCGHGDGGKAWKRDSCREGAI